jgi:hypothetical protein
MTQPQSGFAIGNVVLRLVKDIPVYRHIEPIIGEIERRAILASTKTVLTTGVTSDTVSGYLPLPITHTRPDCRNYWESRISALSFALARKDTTPWPTWKLPRPARSRSPVHHAAGHSVRNVGMVGCRPPCRLSGGPRTASCASAAQVWPCVPACIDPKCLHSAYMEPESPE